MKKYLRQTITYKKNLHNILTNLILLFIVLLTTILDAIFDDPKNIIFCVPFIMFFCVLIIKSFRKIIKILKVKDFKLYHVFPNDYDTIKIPARGTHRTLYALSCDIIINGFTITRLSEYHFRKQRWCSSNINFDNYYQQDIEILYSNETNILLVIEKKH